MLTEDALKQTVLAGELMLIDAVNDNHIKLCFELEGLLQSQIKPK
jgi:hypothetical protein